MRYLVYSILTMGAILSATVRANAQYVPQNPVSDYNSVPEPSSFYLAFSTGIDNYTGIIGLGGLIPLYNEFSLRAGVGLGAWGGKISIGGEYINLMEKGIGFGLSYSHCPGVDGVELSFQDQAGNINLVEVNLHEVGSVNATVKKNWVFKKGHIFYLETGYAFQTGGSDFYTVTDSNVSLTSDEELVLQILRPGGLILAIGFLVSF